MKSKRILRWAALLSVGVLVACGGVSTIGSGEDPGMTAAGKGIGGTKGEGATGAGAEASGGTSRGGKSGVAGMDPGVAGSGAAPSERCSSDKDCPDYGAPCEPCADGSFACNKTFCGADGVCVHTRDSCSVECKTDKECPVYDVPCEACADGSKSCPGAKCVMGSCQNTLPSCGGEAECKGLPCGSACKACAPGDMCDGSAVGYCNQDGKCQAGVPKCGSEPGSCKTRMDCGTPPPVCVPCGNDTCANFECIEEKCVFACPPNPEPECMTVKDCPLLGTDCIECPSDGSCAVPACLSGSCKLACAVK